MPISIVDRDDVDRVGFVDPAQSRQADNVTGLVIAE